MSAFHMYHWNQLSHSLPVERAQEVYFRMRHLAWFAYFKNFNSRTLKTAACQLAQRLQVVDDLIIGDGPLPIICSGSVRSYAAKIRCRCQGSAMYRRRKVATVVNLVGLANVLVDLSADEESARRNVIINECSDSFCDYIRSATMLHTNYSLDDFPSHFRMTRSTFQARCIHFD